jgi:hypothetical protein
MVLNKDEEEDVKRSNMKDTVFVFLISMAVLYGKDYYLSNDSSKAKVFTNEPGF